MRTEVWVGFCLGWCLGWWFWWWFCFVLLLWLWGLRGGFQWVWLFLFCVVGFVFLLVVLWCGCFLVFGFCVGFGCGCFCCCFCCCFGGFFVGVGCRLCRNTSVERLLITGLSRLLFIKTGGLASQ
ncbi:hypothetical protein RA265_27820, partial [Pseudomonas syringae pv. tagetis]|uniref:hypothetical protein n=1 Tax=Pseudomonas syringae group genomosp. 7 TaxID=251699 RepID=UPI00377031DE